MREKFKYGDPDSKELKQSFEELESADLGAMV